MSIHFCSHLCSPTVFFYKGLANQCQNCWSALNKLWSGDARRCRDLRQRALPCGGAVCEYLSIHLCFYISVCANIRSAEYLCSRSSSSSSSSISSSSSRRSPRSSRSSRNNISSSNGRNGSEGLDPPPRAWAWGTIPLGGGWETGSRAHIETAIGPISIGDSPYMLVYWFCMATYFLHTF